MNKWPKVSVVIPFYKNVPWLTQAVDSVFAQEYPETEIIVIDDGSPEDLSLFLNEYSERIVYLKQTNQGPAAARNAGMDAATGKYIALLDADDLWLPGKLQAQVAAMEVAGAVWSHHSYELFWEGRDKTRVRDASAYHGDVSLACRVSFRVMTPCFMFLTQALRENSLRYPAELRFGEDTALYIALARRWPLLYVPGVYARLRMRGDNAGWSARVQLGHKAHLREELKNEELKIKLPISVLFAYWLCGLGWKCARRFKGKRLGEWAARVFYFVPYCLFWVNGRLWDRRQRGNHE